MPRSRGMAFANVFEQLRLAAGLSPADVSRRLDAPDSLVSRWRSGKSVPSLAYLEHLSRLFGVDQHTLETLAGYRASTPTGVQGGIDPEISALMEADRAELHDEFRDIPPSFWPAILQARRLATKAAAEIVRLASAGQTISAIEARGISNARRGQSQIEPPDSEEHGPAFTDNFRLGPSHKQIANALALAGS